jgi:transcriptional regulator with XRE-family HTH domain
MILEYKANLSRNYLSQLEEGEFHASIKVTGEVAEALETEPTEFLRLSPKGKARHINHQRRWPCRSVLMEEARL